MIEPIIIPGDCLDMLPLLNECSVDAIVTDPPYGLGFMGKAWDDLPPGEAWARECLRVLKPGGHLLAFGGTRTSHRLAVAIEDAEFEIRDSIAWLYGSGFPKSLDVSKAIDKAAGAERADLGPGQWAHVKAGGTWTGHVYGDEPGHAQGPRTTAPATPDAERWQGWGTALKPAHEPIVVARKPLIGTVAANVLAHGTGALNIDACRIGTEVRTNGRMSSLGVMHDDDWKPQPGSSIATGRWPANVVLDESQAAVLDEQSGIRPGGAFPGRQNTQPGGANGTMNAGWTGEVGPARAMGDTGGASRFFYVAKAGSKERPKLDGVAHPTVKPLALMRWLVRLVTPPGGTVLDPFLGSGTTAEACMIEGFACIGIEREPAYLDLIKLRLSRRSA